MAFFLFVFVIPPPLVVILQAKGEEVKPETAIQRTRRVIEQTGHVLLPMSSWDDPLPFKRLWCLFEIMCCLVARSQGAHVIGLDWRLSSAEIPKLVETLVDDSTITTKEIKITSTQIVMQSPRVIF